GPAGELVPASQLREEPAPVAELSERDLVAHFTRLTHRQYSVDLGAYPLGSCTMKYNPKLCDDAASLPGLTDVHPAAPAALTQGWMQLLAELARALCRTRGVHAATLPPPVHAGARQEVGGLLYDDGADLNDSLGVTRPGDMGIDIVHMNLHRTSAAPHGGGGPGAGPGPVSERLAPHLPGPRRVLGDDGAYRW